MCQEREAAIACHQYTVCKHFKGCPRCNEPVFFTPNLHNQLEGAAVSITNFTMFAIRNTSDFGPGRDGCAVRRPISISMSATKRAKCPYIVPCFPYRHASYSPKNRWEGTHLHGYILYSRVRGLHAPIQYYGNLVPTCTLRICRKSCIVNVRATIWHDVSCLPFWSA